MSKTIPTTYRHSEVFAALKATNERIKTNLTTGQYLKTLDEYLLNAVTPIIEATGYFDVFLPKMLAWQTENFRRKLSMKNIDLPSAIMYFLLQSLPEDKLTLWKGLCLDRAVVFYALQNFLDALEEYELACNCEGPVPNFYKDSPLAYYLHVTRHHESSLSARRPLLPVIQQVRYWLNEAMEFKRRILEKYTRLCLTTAQKDYVAYFNCQVPLDDIVQSYIIAASRAIDKCDASQGVLTSHIQNWLLTARNHLSKSMTAEHQEVSLDSVEGIDNLVTQKLTSLMEELTDTAENIDHVRRISRLADLTGYGRILLGIEESLPVATRAFLRSFAV